MSIGCVYHLILSPVLLLQPVVEIHQSQLYFSSRVWFEQLPHHFSWIEEHCKLVKEESYVSLGIVRVRNVLSFDGIKVVEKVEEDGFLCF